MVKRLRQYPDSRPETRGQCADMPRPCPFVSCRHHLAHSQLPKKGRKRRTDAEIADHIVNMDDSCSLDVADEVELGRRLHVVQLARLMGQPASHGVKDLPGALERFGESMQGWRDHEPAEQHETMPIVAAWDIEE